MTLGEKLCKLRKENNVTQEQLADRLGVSRQSISKWESDAAYPETEKLIRISELFDCSLDYLLKESVTDKETKTQFGRLGGQSQPAAFPLNGLFNFNYEYKSEKTVFGVPLVHINIGRGRTAKGIISLGYKSVGVISLGLMSAGLFSFGLLAFGFLGLGIIGAGIIGLGTFAFGFFSGGAISVGIISFGAVSVGVMSCGAVSIGRFAVGALAKGHYFAFGDRATALVAIGATEAEGTLYAHFTGIKNDFSGYDAQTVTSLLHGSVPSALKWLMNIALSISDVLVP